MEKKSKRKYYIIIILLIIYLAAMVIFIVYPSSVTSSRRVYIMVDNVAKWKFEGKSWEDISSDESNLYNWQKFDLYRRNQYFGNYYLLYNDRWLVYDDDRNPVQKSGSNLLAVRSNQDFKVATYTTTDIPTEQMQYVEQVLTDHNIDPDTELVTKEMITYDIDNDGQEESIITISNLFETTYAPSRIFSFIFTVKDGKIALVSSMVDTLDHKNEHCSAYVHSLVDTDNNGKYEIITGCGYYNSNRNCVEMYENKNDQYQKIKACGMQ